LAQAAAKVLVLSECQEELKAMKVGFIGLGNMGSGLAANLLKAGHALTVYNRTSAKAEALIAKGATLAKTPGEAARGDVVITMLADDAAVEGMVFGADGVLAGLRPGSIHISMSTISISLAERLASAHQAAGQRFVAAPVFGRPEAAVSGKLFIVAGGEPKSVHECQPLFEALGQRTFVIADEPPKANLVKLSGNFLIASVIETLGEAFALVSKAGIDRAGYLDILTNTLFAAPVYKTYGGIIAEQRYAPPGFKAMLGFKDIHLALAAAEALQVPMPVASLLRDRFLTLIATGAGDLDWSALAALASRDAGDPSSRFAAK
jgi:3-hydroxyisobutyrate dehydrogenase-like beta-hydroxyacid dehydrogenase